MATNNNIQCSTSNQDINDIIKDYDIIDDDKIPIDENNGMESLEKNKDTDSISRKDSMQGKNIVEIITPPVNCPEKIVICIDLSNEMDNLHFRLGDKSKIPTLNLIRKAVTMFVLNKNKLNDKHEFALVVLLSSATLTDDANSNPRYILETLGNLDSTQPFNSFDMSSLFQLLDHNFQLPEIDEPELVPPPYVVRVIFIYTRSNCVPELNDTPEVQKFLQSPYFFLDAFYIHEPPSENNQCEEIYNMICDMDYRNSSYIFEIVRNTTKFFDYMAQFLAHPLQRPVQKDKCHKIDIDDTDVES